jgi:hypothetical protein
MLNAALLTDDELRVLRYALADQDRIIDRSGESAYYRNVTDDDTAAIVGLERARVDLLERLL